MHLRLESTIKNIDEFEAKLNLLTKSESTTIEKVLIALQGADESLINQAYFDYIITLEDLLPAIQPANF